MDRTRHRSAAKVVKKMQLGSLGPALIGILMTILASLSPRLAHAQSDGADSARTPALYAGDVLRITVWRQPELSGEFVIAPDGTITHPLYRELKVAGLTLPTVEERVRAFLSRFESNPEFVILPLLRIIVAGEVRQPNVYTVPVGTSVPAAIALAGGPTERGQLERVKVNRSTASFALDLTQPSGTAMRIAVRSGDQIIVGRRRNFVQDVLAPMSSVIAAAAAIATVVIQLSK